MRNENNANEMTGQIDGLTGDAGSVADRPMSSGHLPALDGLRGLAIILVLIYHFGVGLTFIGFERNEIIRIMMMGWVGVDLFFVLSGFLITGILYDSKGDPHYFRNFYIRRALRIFPIYFLCILLVYVAVQLLPPLNNDQNDGFIYPLTFTTNLAVAFKADWYEIPVIMAHYWSLAIEEQFYLIWPIIIFLSPLNMMLRISMGIIVSALLLRVGMTFSGFDANTIFALTLTRCDALAVGAFCALSIRNPDFRRRVLKWAPQAALFSFIIVVAITLYSGELSTDSPWVQTFGFSALCIGAGALMLLILSRNWLNSLFSATALRWFGRYSYGIYVWHYPIYFVGFEVEASRRLLGIQADWTGLVYFSAAIVGSIVCGVVSYHVVEKRFLAFKDHFQSKRV